jgi:transcriptional regulator with XRE-family HTH domain
MLEVNKYMIGLEYILNIYGMKHQELADMLIIKKQNVNLWIKGKQAVSKKHYDRLYEIFKIPQEYFQKELNEIDKLRIDQIKLENEMVTFEYEEIVTNPTTGEDVTIISRYRDFNTEDEISRLEYEISQKELLIKINEILNVCFIDGHNPIYGGLNEALKLLELFKMFTTIISDSKIDRLTIEMILKAVRTSYQQYDTKDKFIKNIAEMIKEQDDKIKLEKDEIKRELGNQDNDDLFG